MACSSNRCWAVRRKATKSPSAGPSSPRRMADILPPVPCVCLGLRRKLQRYEQVSLVVESQPTAQPHHRSSDVIPRRAQDPRPARRAGGAVFGGGGATAPGAEPEAASTARPILSARCL